MPYSGKMLTPYQQKISKQVTSGKFRWFLFSQLPMGLIAGLRVVKLTEEQCITSVPYKWLTKNPFQSMYFAVQSMAAELSTASTCMLATAGEKPSVAFIIVDLKASFYKKATDKVYFTCENASDAFKAVEACKETREAATATFKTVGKMPDGTVVSEFEFAWSFKQRKS